MIPIKNTIAHDETWAVYGAGELEVMNSPDEIIPTICDIV